MSKGPIQNAADVPFNVREGSIPNMSDALLDWYQDMQFNKVTKTMAVGKVQEEMVLVNFRGIINPFTGRQLYLKPEGERKWKWHEIFSDAALVLKPDDVVQYKNTQYRVMWVGDYRIYGYMQYHVIEDYTGVGPTVEGGIVDNEGDVVTDNEGNIIVDNEGGGV